MLACARTACLVLGAISLAPVGTRFPEQTGYLTWTGEQARKTASSTRENGRISAGQGLLHTERATSYKLRATWLTSEVIRAGARLTQLSDRLTNEQTDALVKEAEDVAGTVIIVEIDPRQGSGVIPLDWAAFLGPRANGPAAIREAKGSSVPKLRDVRAFAGVFRRDYDYEAFWMMFPLRTESGEPLFRPGDVEAELVVRIFGKEGRVRWLIPEWFKER